VPVINGLTDLLHPCQVLADLMTVREALGGWEGKTVAWIGDGNNMANSWINAAGLLGFTLRIACPEGYDPNPAILARNGGIAAGGGIASGPPAPRNDRIRVMRNPAEAAAGADVVTTDVWASMGQEAEAEVRARAFAGYRVDEAMMTAAAPGAIFLHCLPAHRGEEVTDGVIEGPWSRIWDEAENRLHIQKALMAALMGDDKVRLT
jgi:ornithine carbamoyltransferase